MGEIVRFYLAAVVLGAASAPFFRLFGSKEIVCMWAAGKVAGICLFALILCLIGSLGFNPWSFPSICSLTLIVAFSWYLFFLNNRDYMRRNMRLLLAQLAKLEIPAAVIFLFACAFISTSPAVYGTEKLMDFAILKSIYSSSALPPIDLWFSGRPINYYWFGHMEAALLCRTSSVAPDSGFNLMVALVFSQLFQVTAAILIRLGLRFKQAITGAILVVMSGNLVPWYHLKNGLSAVFDLWSPSRIIPGTITEFPFFSLFVGDMHAHFLMLPVFLAFTFYLIANIASKKEEDDIRTLFALNILVVATWLGNPWNLAPMAVLFICIKIFSASPLPWWSLLPGLAICPFVSFIKGHSVTLQLVSHPSPLLPFFLMWGQPIVIIILWLLSQRRLYSWKKAFFFALPLTLLWHSPVLSLLGLLAILMLLSMPQEENHKISTSLVLSALALLAACEILYLKDIYPPPYERMNTVFKLSYCAWLLFMIGGIFFLFQQARPLQKRFGTPATIFLTVVAASGLIYPCLGVAKRLTAVHYKDLTMNGLAPLERLHPDELSVIYWLRKHVRPHETCLEAPGVSYTWQGAIPALSGCPVPLGWEQHEWLWRGSLSEISKRKKDIETFFRSKNRELKMSLIGKYRIKYIIACKREKDLYGQTWLDGLDGMVKKEFSRGTCSVYSVNKRQGGGFLCLSPVH